MNEDAVDLSVALVREVSRTLELGETEPVKELALSLHAADLAELIGHLSSEKRAMLVGLISGAFDPEILAHLAADVRDEVMDILGIEKSAAAIAELDRDDAVHVIEDLSEEEQQEILEAIPDEDAREDLEEGLAYPESSAGRMMQTEIVAVPEFWTVGNTIDYLRGAEHLPSDFYVIFVVDPTFKPVGAVVLSRLMKNKRETAIQTIMDEDIHSVHTHTDQEEVAHIFRKYGLVEAPVTNDGGRLVGTITIDDVVDVIQEEGEEDFMRLGGVTHQDFHTPVRQAATHRMVWLFVNLLTAALASFVISRFQSAIHEIVALAVLMPIIASMGGNAGIQTVTVVVRAIATRQLSWANALPTLKKEVLIGGMNGLVLAAITSVGVGIMFQNHTLALVFGAGITLNLLIAGFWGVIFPLVFTRLKIDPAITSGVFLTMMTDVTGFFTFLGLAALFLL